MKYSLNIGYFLKVAAITSPFTQQVSSVYTSVVTFHFLGWISFARPTARNSVSSVVGWIKSTCKEAVTKRRGSIPSPGLNPFFRCNAYATDAVLWQSIRGAIRPP